MKFTRLLELSEEKITLKMVVEELGLLYCRAGYYWNPAKGKRGTRHGWIIFIVAHAETYSSTVV